MNNLIFIPELEKSIRANSIHSIYGFPQSNRDTVRILTIDGQHEEFTPSGKSAADRVEELGNQCNDCHKPQPNIDDLRSAFNAGWKYGKCSLSSELYRNDSFNLYAKSKGISHE